jgi:hypothetical protein
MKKITQPPHIYMKSVSKAGLFLPVTCVVSVITYANLRIKMNDFTRDVTMNF